jgi:hypothetical protein
VALPGQTAMMVSLAVTTEPAGARLYLDDVEVAGNTLRLERGGSASHTLVAETDCMIETLVITPQQVASGGSIHMPLKTPKIVPVMVATVPPGARITLDGKDTGRITPHELQVATCGEHQVGLAMKGFTDVTTKLAQPPEPLKVTLARLPEGFVKISTDYPVAVFKDGKKIGASGESLKLRSGRHTLTLRNDDLFLERAVSVDVGTDRTSVSRVPLPGVGSLTVLASPSNCTIFINGRDMGAPPINDYQIAEGTYTVRAVFVPTGEAKESSVVVAAGSQARVPFKFSP